MTSIFEDYVDLDLLAGDLRSPEPARRRIAILALRDSGDQGAVDLIGQAVADADDGVRGEAAGALGAFDGFGAATHLALLLSDPNPAVAQAAADSLTELKDADAAPALVPLVSHARPFVRAAALRGLKALRTAEGLAVARAAKTSSGAAARDLGRAPRVSKAIDSRCSVSLISGGLLSSRRSSWPEKSVAVTNRSSGWPSGIRGALVSLAAMASKASSRRLEKPAPPNGG